MLARVFALSHGLDSKVFANADNHCDGRYLLYMCNNEMLLFNTEKITLYNRYLYFKEFVFPV